MSYNKKIFLYLTFFVLKNTLNAQINPLFDDTKVNTVFIVMNEDSLLNLYTNIAENHDYHATFIYDDGVSLDTIENVGIRLRGNTSLSAAKKSYKISFNAFDSGNQFHGTEKLNLNGSHNDPSMLREKLYFDTYSSFGLPKRQSSFVKLYINANYYGLYCNIEEYDEIFLKNRFGNATGNLYKCTYPADLKYISDNQTDYKSIWGAGDRAYDLQTNEEEDDYSDLIAFIKVINQTPNDALPCALEKIFEVDDFLKIIALDVASGNWDNYVYNKNNYFLYHDAFTHKIRFLSYDCDNTFGVDWVDVNWTTRDIYHWAADDRPLINRLLEVPVYKDKFSFYLNQLINTILKPENINPRLDSLQMLITPAAFLDDFKSYDWGYSDDDFLSALITNSIDGHTPFGVENFIAERNTNALAQLIMNPIAPIIKNENHFPLLPNAEDEVDFNVTCFDDLAILNIQLFYSYDSTYYLSTFLYDDGLHYDGFTNDSTYCNTVLANSENGFLYYYFEATDNVGNTTRYPICNVNKIKIGYTVPSLVINEFMAKNTVTWQDEFDNFSDYIEIYNAGNASVYLGNYYLSDKFSNPTKFKLPSINLAPDAYILLYADDTHLNAYHTNFRLNSDGDHVGIFSDAENFYTAIDTANFLLQQADIATGRLPNGTGNFVPLSYPSPNYNNESIIIFDSIAQFGITILGNPIQSSSQILLQLDISATVTLDIFAIDGNAVDVSNPIYLTKGDYFFSLETDKLAKGMYFLRAKVNSEMLISKFVVL